MVKDAAAVVNFSLKHVHITFCVSEIFCVTIFEMTINNKVISRKISVPSVVFLIYLISLNFWFLICKVGQ